MGQQKAEYLSTFEWECEGGRKGGMEGVPDNYSGRFVLIKAKEYTTDE